MALADNGIFPAASTDAINEKLAAIPGFPEDGTDALNITSWVLDRPIDAKMAAVRKVLEEEHDLIMIGEEDIDTGIANMNQRAKEAIIQNVRASDFSLQRKLDALFVPLYKDR